jgi:hypothetical protein
VQRRTREPIELKIGPRSGRYDEDSPATPPRKTASQDLAGERVRSATKDPRADKTNSGPRSGRYDEDSLSTKPSSSKAAGAKKPAPWPHDHAGVGVIVKP